MTDKPLFYAVSFGDSEKYRVEDSPEKSAHRRLDEVEDSLRDYLKSQFPGETFAYFVTPKVEDVFESNRGAYESLKPLDDKAVSEIEQVLARGVRDMNATRDLNSDAPFSNISPDAL